MNLKQLQNYAVATVLESLHKSQPMDKKARLTNFLESIIDDKLLLEAMIAGASIIIEGKDDVDYDIEDTEADIDKLVADDEDFDEDEIDRDYSNDVSNVRDLMERYTGIDGGKATIENKMDIFKKWREADGKLNKKSVLQILSLFISTLVSPLVDNLVSEGKASNLEDVSIAAKADPEKYARMTENLKSIKDNGDLEEFVAQAVKDMFVALNNNIDVSKFDNWGQFHGYLYKLLDGTLKASVREAKGERKSPTASHGSNTVQAILDGEGKVNQEGQQVRFAGKKDGKEHIFKLLKPYPATKEVEEGSDEDDGSTEAFVNAIAVLDDASDSNGTPRKAEDMADFKEWEYIGPYTGEAQAADAPEWESGRTVVIGGKGNSRSSVMYKGSVYRLDKTSDALTKENGKLQLSANRNKVPPDEANAGIWIKEDLPSLMGDSIESSDVVNKEQDETNEVSAPDNYEPADNEYNNSRDDAIASTHSQFADNDSQNIAVSEDKLSKLTADAVPLVTGHTSYKKLVKLIPFGESEVHAVLTGALLNVLNKGEAVHIHASKNDKDGKHKEPIREYKIVKDITKEIRSILSDMYSDEELAAIRRSGSKIGGSEGESTDGTAANALFIGISEHISKVLANLVLELSKGNVLDLFLED